MDDEEVSEFIPRAYQTQLMKLAAKENTIIYLPTGSGKTFIALMVLKHLSKPLERTYGQNGKISIILVNTVTLVSQHAKYFEKHTNFKVGKYTGEMNLDFWPKDKWYEEYEKHNIIIMTSQILLNLLKNNYISLDRINLLIFDECHHGVLNHSMRQIMLLFQDIKDPPRVLGLTATLLNGNCKPHKVTEEVKCLETTFHGKVATVDGLEDIIGYSTNPKERIKQYTSHMSSVIEQTAKALLDQVIATITAVNPEEETAPILKLNRLQPEGSENKRKLLNLINDFRLHIDILGVFGGHIATLCYKIQVQRLRVHCDDIKQCQIFTYVISIMTYIENLFKIQMKDVKGKDKILKYSSNQVRVLISIFEEFKTISNVELCGIVFTQRRFTAKIIHHILKAYNEEDPSFGINSEFLVGYQNNPYNSTRESLYITKKNKQVIESFVRKEVNLLCSSNILEEGVDIPRCTLVIKFDKPMDYRSYIQSKGRARHRESFYYIMVDEAERDKYVDRFKGFQQIEQILNQYLIGKNENRDAPSSADINNMYNEETMRPYFVDGPGSAQVNMLSAIPLLCQYCQSLPGDIYTQYAPDWYIERKSNENKVRVVILMPTICPLVDPIEGPWMITKKDAKRAAALETCKKLHKIGELDDHLLPKRHEVQEEDVKFLFSHYPAVKESQAGTNKMRRLHKKQVPIVLQGPIQPNKKCYLHIINLTPAFQRKEDLNVSSLYDCYVSPTCYAFITPKPLPTLCDFPTYTSLGCVDVNVQVNHSEVMISNQDLDDIKYFHFIVFDNVLDVFNHYLAFDNSKNAETLLLVPFDKLNNKIDYENLRRRHVIKPFEKEMSYEDKMNLEVTQESHLRTIVSPVYRNTGTYLVTEVSLNKSPLSDFPNENYGNFVDYYEQKHSIDIKNKKQPLLLVKGLSKRLNLIKPRGTGAKRKREKTYDEVLEYLIPELVVKQDFPADLWIQASFLPTVLTRIIFLLQVDELRAKIARESNLGNVILKTCQPLQVDPFLLNYDVNLEQSEKQTKEKLTLENTVPVNENLFSDLTQKIYNKDYCAKLTEAEFPWKDIDEPKDIERELKISILDIEFYENFVQKTVNEKERNTSSPYRKNQLAITYYNDNYVFREIKFLNIHFNNQGPEQRELYEALTTAKANDIVNLERLETLGDSFLKLISSLYISLRFPQFNEGQATSLKGRLVSNKNLYYLAVKKKLGGIMRYSDLSPKEKWLPPSYSTPEIIRNKILKKEISVESLFDIHIPREEQIDGVFSPETLTQINKVQSVEEEVDDSESCLHSTCEFLSHQYIGDKHVSDVVESIIGLYFQKGGFTGAAKIVEWLGIIPKGENLLNLLRTPVPNPIINPKGTMEKVEYFLTQAKGIESNLGYKFKNRAFLLQALTHASYSINRVTRSYETLEFLGDAVLDFLVTCHIFEYCGHLGPGELTDLRSALVNNNTFASLAVRCGFHKSLLMMNAQLQGQIDKFATYLESKNYEIDDEVTILLEETDMNLAEYVDVPKILGDIFEALIGAVYLDSGKDLTIVWKVVHKIMHREIELFRKHVPINVVRKLYETPGLYPTFSDPQPAGDHKTMIALQYFLQGRKKIVYGFGINKAMAKKAAAKIALRSLNL